MYGVKYWYLTLCRVYQNWRHEKLFVDKGETNSMDKTGVNIHIGENILKISKIEPMGWIKGLLYR